MWCGEPKDMLLVGRMDGSLGLIEVLDAADMHRVELEHCYRKDGMNPPACAWRGAAAGGVTACRFSVAVMHIAWFREDRPFAVGYADGKLLIGSKEPLEKGAIVVIDAHKVSRSRTEKPDWFQRRSSNWCLFPPHILRSPSPV